MPIADHRHSIIAVRGYSRGAGEDRLVPPLSNRELFLRDGHLCMYCGREFSGFVLTRDHLIPLSRGGVDCWSNVVTACRGCNHAKGSRTPDEADMSLLAVPYVPNRAEYLVLSNRRILADQMEFLKKRFRRSSRLQTRLTVSISRISPIRGCQPRIGEIRERTLRAGLPFKREFSSRRSAR